MRGMTMLVAAMAGLSTGAFAQRPAAPVSGSASPASRGGAGPVDPKPGSRVPVPSIVGGGLSLPIPDPAARGTGGAVASLPAAAAAPQPCPAGARCPR